MFHVVLFCFCHEAAWLHHLLSSYSFNTNHFIIDWLVSAVNNETLCFFQDLRGAIARSRTSRTPSPGTAVVYLIPRSESMMLE
jgi:hypothetical protein